MARRHLRPAWADVDLDAVAHNVSTLHRLVHPSRLCAVVKADGYGHGAVAVAGAAVEAGAEWLAVALVEEGIELREAGIEAPVLVLSEPDPAAMADAVEAGLTPTVYRPEGIAAVAGAARAVGRRVGVHLKVDTGMHRVGADPEQAVDLALAVAASGWLSLEGLWTHFAVADDPANPHTGLQRRRFEQVRARLAAAGLEPPLLHAANSAGALWHPGSRYDLVRCGIAVYGYGPDAGRPADSSGQGGVSGEGAFAPAAPCGLRPVLSLRARVSLVRELPAGERVSYGLRRPLAQDSWVATVPIGYADGFPRRLFDAGATALVRGRRRPLAGAVTMDQLLLDCGPNPDVAVGDEVVLIGSQGLERIGADEWARALGTISYEVLCGIGARVPRVAVRGGGQRPGPLPRARQ